MNIPSTDANQHSRYDDSETFTEISTTNLLTSFVLPTKTLNVQHTRQEPLIMQAEEYEFFSTTTFNSSDIISYFDNFRQLLENCIFLFMYYRK